MMQSILFSCATRSNVRPVCYAVPRRYANVTLGGSSRLLCCVLDYPELSSHPSNDHFVPVEEYGVILII